MEDYLVYYKSGMESCRKGLLEEGIAAFDKALHLNPSHLESLYNRAKARFKLQKFEECLEDFALALNISPDNPLLLSERAVVFYHMKNIDKALEDLEKAVQLDPENPYRYASRAYMKDKAGDLQGAIYDYNKAIALDPEDAISYNNRGLVEEKLGYHNRAKESFRKADGLTGAKTAAPVSNDRTNHYAEENLIRPAPQKPKRYPAKAYLKWIKKVFSSKEGFRDFLSFTIDFFRIQKK